MFKHFVVLTTIVVALVAVAVFSQGDLKWHGTDSRGNIEIETANAMFRGQNAAGPGMLNEASTATNPTLVPDRSDLTSGMGGTSDGISLITGGVDAVTVDSSQTVTINVGYIKPTETVITTNVITAAESGTTFFLDLAGGFTSTLPAPAAGLHFKFVVITNPTTAYIIATNGGADIMIGGINELEVDTTNDGPYDANADALSLVANIAVVGDFVEMISDGTSWYYFGQTNADGGVTTATT